MKNQKRKVKSVNLGYHKPTGRWYFRSSYGSTKEYLSNGTVKYHQQKTDEYVNVEWYTDPKNTVERQINKETRKYLDELLQTKRLMVRNGKGTVQPKSVQKRNIMQDFYEYYNDSSREYSNSTITNHKTILSHLKKYTEADSYPWSDVDEDFCEGFLHYLKEEATTNNRGLSKNSIAGYFNKFKVFLGWAHKKGLLAEYPAEEVKAPKGKPMRKETLTEEEVKKLMIAPCADPVMKRWFLFSCMSGQAHAECRAMAWKDIYEREGVTYIDATRIKTNSDYTVPLNDEAVLLLGKRQPNEIPVFKGLVYSPYKNRLLSDWAREAGIDKKITPHVARHTFAANFYRNTKDVMALMEILDHRELSTTQRYLSSLLGNGFAKPKPNVGNYDLDKMKDYLGNI